MGAPLPVPRARCERCALWAPGHLWMAHSAQSPKFDATLGIASTRPAQGCSSSFVCWSWYVFDAISMVLGACDASSYHGPWETEWRENFIKGITHDVFKLYSLHIMSLPLCSAVVVQSYYATRVTTKHHSISNSGSYYRSNYRVTFKRNSYYGSNYRRFGHESMWL